MTGLSSAAGSNLKKRIKRITAADVRRSPSALHRLLVGVVGAMLVVLTMAAGRVVSSEGQARNGNLYGGVVDPRFVEPAAGEAEGIHAATDNEAASNLARLPQAPYASTQIKTTPVPILEVRVEPSRNETNSPSEVNSSQIPGSNVQLRNEPPPTEMEAGARASAPSVAIIPAAVATRDDLREFTGRYEVDPARVENFVLDITLEYGELWLKPSHTHKHKLLRTSATGFTDAESDFRFTALRSGAGRVIGLRLDSWSSEIIARKVVLPQASLKGNMTFRLKGYANARVVALAGSFNNWNQSQLIFAREGDEWVCRVNLPPGKHQYKFVIDRNWITDPNNPKTVNDDRGITNSLLSAE